MTEHQHPEWLREVIADAHAKHTGFNAQGVPGYRDPVLMDIYRGFADAVLDALLEIGDVYSQSRLDRREILASPTPDAYLDEFRDVLVIPLDAKPPA